MISVHSVLAVVVMFWSGWLVQVADASIHGSQQSKASASMDEGNEWEAWNPNQMSLDALNRFDDKGDSWEQSPMYPSFSGPYEPPPISSAFMERKKTITANASPAVAEFLRFGARAFYELGLDYSRPLTAADKVRLTEFFSMHASALWEAVGKDLLPFFEFLWMIRPDKAREERISRARGKGYFRRSLEGNRGKAGNDDYSI